MANPFPFVAGEVLTAADMNGIGEWTSYTPILTAATTNPTLGTGSSQIGSYARIQNLIIYRFQIIFGTSGVNPGLGIYAVSLPVTATLVGGPSDVVSGQTSFTDNSANNVYYSNAWVDGTTKISIIVQAAFNGSQNYLTNAVPVTPAANDRISGLIIYQAA